MQSKHETAYKGQGTYNQSGYHAKGEGYNKGQFSGKGCGMFVFILSAVIVGGSFGLYLATIL